MLPVTLELQPPIQAAGGGLAVVNQSVAGAAEALEGEVGLTHGRAPEVFKKFLLFYLQSAVFVVFASSGASNQTLLILLRVDTTHSPINMTFTL